MDARFMPAIRRLSVLVFAVTAQVFAAGQVQAVTVDLQLKTTWDSGFTTDVVIKNDTSSTINGWKVKFQLGNHVDSAYSATYSGSDPYTFKNLDYNAEIKAGNEVKRTTCVDMTKSTLTNPVQAPMPSYAGLTQARFDQLCSSQINPPLFPIRTWNPQTPSAARFDNLTVTDGYTNAPF